MNIDKIGRLTEAMEAGLDDSRVAQAKKIREAYSLAEDDPVYMLLLLQFQNTQSVKKLEDEVSANTAQLQKIESGLGELFEKTGELEEGYDRAKEAIISLASELERAIGLDDFAAKVEQKVANAISQVVMSEINVSIDKFDMQSVASQLNEITNRNVEKISEAYEVGNKEMLKYKAALERLKSSEADSKRVVDAFTQISSSFKDIESQLAEVTKALEEVKKTAPAAAKEVKLLPKSDDEESGGGLIHRVAKKLGVADKNVEE